MTVRAVPQAEYFSALGHTSVYGSPAYHRATPAPEGTVVRYLVGYDESARPRLGLVAGWDGTRWRAPYSAPFAEVACGPDESLERVYDFISELTHQLDAPLTVTLAPPLYGGEMLQRVTGTLANYATRVIFDYNYHYPLPGGALTPQAYSAALGHAARKNLRRGLEAGFSFGPTDDIDRAYAVILANRQAHGYPLAMSLERVKATVAEAVRADFLLLTLDGRDVAAAMVYHAAEGIAQVVYWGDVPGYSELRPMNTLACHVFSHYSALGFRAVDVGPSSTQGVPNAGLCRFKQSIGCVTTLKPTLIFQP